MRPAFSFLSGLLAVQAWCTPAAFADDGALDPTFGTGGKVMVPASSEGSGPSSVVATDVAVQAAGRTIVAGNDDANDCFVAALKGNGDLDGGFSNGNGFAAGFSGYGACAYSGVAIRPDDRIVAVGNFEGATFGIVNQFTASGGIDNSFGVYAGGTNIVPDSENDRIYPSRVVIDSDGSIDVAGTYYQQSFNGNQFFFARISADGKTVETFRYQFGSGANQDDHALDLAIDSQGRYVLVGYHRGAAGNYDCAAIRIRRDLYDVDAAFGNAGQTTVAFDLGGDNGDFCNAVAIFPGGFIAIGGHATASTGGGTYQSAVLAELDGDGNLDQYSSGGLLHSATFAFTYSLNPVAGQTNDITKLIVDGYDTKYPQLLAIGTGNQYAQPPGPYFGIARLNPAQIYSNFTLDPSLNGKGVMGVYFVQRPTGLGNYITTNDGLSGTFVDGKLVVAGYTQAVGGNQIAITRLAAFDGILKNGFETPSY